MPWRKIAKPRGVIALLSNALRVCAGLVLCFGLYAVPPANAASQLPAAPIEKKVPADPDMNFIIVRSDANSCEPNCPEWITAQGKITAGTADKLSRLLANPTNRKLPILLNSYGGDIRAALTMGRMIRRYQMTTTIGRTHFSFCDPFTDNTCRPSVSNKAYRGTPWQYGAKCMSACPLVLLGGVVRILDDASYLGLHQPTTVSHPYMDRYWVTWRMIHGQKVIISRKLLKRISLPSKTSIGLSSRLKGTLGSYIKEMNASSAIMDEMEKAGPSTMNLITHSKAHELGLSTRFESLDIFAKPDICAGASPAEHCVLIK